MSLNVAEKLRQRSTEIVISVDQKQTVDAAEAALIRLEGVYVKARTLVQVVRDMSESPTSGIKYPDGYPVTVKIGPERLRELCGSAATWLSARKKKDEVEMVEVQCPAWVVATLLQRGEWKLPQLDGISGSPIFRADGTICDTPGYDASTRLIYDPGADVFPAIKRTPTLDDARRAYEALIDPFFDFPTVKDHDKAAIVAVILTVLARSAIAGLTPVFVAEATTRGSGKGLLFDTCSTITTGTIAPKRPPSVNEDEFRKSMFASAMEGPPLVMIDNAEGAIGSPTFAMMVTAGAISDRLLGVSETRSVAVRFVTLVTGNNLQWKKDLARRIVPIQLDPRCENPEDRTGFRYENLLEHVRSVRPQLVSAALTMLRAYVVAGRPPHGKPAMGSFEAWDRLIRGAVIWASGRDPIGGVQRIREDGDEDRDQLCALITSWRSKIGIEPVTAAEAVKMAGEQGDLHDAIAAYCKSGKPESKRLGYILRQYRGRVVNGLSFEKSDLKSQGGILRYKVTGGNSGNSGNDPTPRQYANDGDDDQEVVRSLPPSPPLPPNQPGPVRLFGDDVLDDARRHVSMHGYEEDE